MRYGSTVGSFARALYDAERRLGFSTDELDFIAYVESYGNTSLGWGGISGQAMSSALVTVVTCGRNYVVYVAGRFCYRLDSPDPLNPLEEHHDPKYRDGSA